MGTTKPHKVTLEKEKETLLITLYAKALDSHSKNSILNDKKAAELMDLMDYNFNKITDFGNHIMVIRAKQFDTWVKNFLETSPNTTVLNLGCGLDTRVSRIMPSPRVKWYDVDFPEVIEIRKEFYTNQNGYKMIASSITELDWLGQIPNDNPAVIIAEGVLEYLTEEQVKVLFNRLTNHFPSGQLIFDVMNTFAINSGKENLKETTGAEHKWMVDEIKTVDKLNTQWKRINKLSIFKSPYIRKLPLKDRFIYTALCLIPSFRNMMTLLVYKF
ncbi:class I SAM-dependent methyltransferase [Heyndrickxia camelliae]|uniref:Class I SAM-dependent methyltransferase n=1 Tax=Heyndrickxia camelliae TaxID=1707093 RepID=A0A2N3LIR1_9BACI|nr:class I SAM-dependent methyltransferase [Heyndrickxia camelliae]PKR84429.1 class I SAM-dependent methyltransferase [Heyndrickxia camelliae]